MRRSTAPKPGSVRAALVEAVARSGLSQNEIARRMGVTDGRVSQIVCGTHSGLQWRSIERLASALGHRATLVLTPVPGPESMEEAYSQQLSDECECLVQARDNEEIALLTRAVTRRDEILRKAVAILSDLERDLRDLKEGRPIRPLVLHEEARR